MPIATDLPTREHGRWWEATSSHTLACALAPTGGYRHQDGPASTGHPIHGVNQRQRSYRAASATTTNCPAVRAAGSAASWRAYVVEGASARGALGSCMGTTSDNDADGTTEFQKGEEHNFESF
jgi:hypothetical protein